MKAITTVTIHESFLQSFSLEGALNSDGQIISRTGAILDGWPQEIELEGKTFCLDEVYADEQAGYPMPVDATYYLKDYRKLFNREIPT